MSESAKHYKLITKCRGCGAAEDAWTVALRMDPMPLAGEFPQTQPLAEAALLYPLTWVVCAYCELAQVLEDVPDGILYSTYNYGSSAVPGLVRHFDAYSQFLSRRHGPTGRALEIGCNDGVLLSRLPRSWDKVGVDPSDVAARVEGRNYQLINQPFGEHLLGTTLETGSFDLITSSNAFAHFTELHGALKACRGLLKPTGELILEVHDLDATLAEGQWDTIYHEHKVEWSEISLTKCLRAAGFERTFCHRMPLHGGLLRCGFRPTKSSQALKRIPIDRGKYSFLRHQYEARRDTELFQRLQSLQKLGQIAAYGASGRANVWLNQMAELTFEHVLDASPLRATRWIPGRTIPIHQPAAFDLDAQAYLITAWNYASDIKAAHKCYSGKWLQSFPQV